MGVIDFGTGSFLVKFDDSYSDGLFAIQGETARAYRFILTDLDNHAIDTKSIELGMNIFVKRTKAGTAKAKRVEADGSFLMVIPQGLILEHDENAKYQIFIKDDKGNMLSQKEGKFSIFANRSFEAEGIANLLFDFEEFQKALDMQYEYLIQMADNLNRTIIARNEAQESAKESTESKDISVQIKNELSDIFDSEEARKQAHANRTTTWNGWFDVIENAKTGWKTTFSKWTDNFNTWTNKINEWFTKLASFETAENTRASNETQRNHAEDNRVASEKSRNLKEQNRIENDAKHTESDKIRQANADKINDEWLVLKEQLSEIDAGNLQLQINDIVENTKEYIKFAQINSITNSLELFLGKDTTEPTIKMPLPQGFSGKYADLSDKPDIYTQTEANNKFVTKVANKGLSTHDYDDIAQSKVKDIPGIKEDVKALQDTIQVYDGKFHIKNSLPENLEDYEDSIIFTIVI